MTQEHHVRKQLFGSGIRGIMPVSSHIRSAGSLMPHVLPPAFNKLAWSNLAAQSAEQLSLAAVPIVAVMLLGAGAGDIGFLATVQTLPFLLLSIPLGLVADRSSRRRLMVGSELVRTLAFAGLLAAVLTSKLSLPVLWLLGFTGALGTVGFSVAAPALVPSLVPVQQLGAANARLELARSVAYAGGPALAGALVAWAGASFAFVLAAALSASAVVLLLRLPEPQRAASPTRRPMQELADGARLVWHDPMLRPIMLTTIVWNISWFILQAVYVPYAVRTLGLSASTVGITLACYGVGMVLGALLAKRVVAALPFGKAILVGPAVSVLAALAMVMSLFTTMPTSGAIFAALSFFLFGAGPILWTITSVTLRQTLTPGMMLGRVSAIFLTVGFGARPIGAAVGGIVGSHWGEAACLVLALAGFVLQAAFIFSSRVRGLKVLPPQVTAVAAAAEVAVSS